MRVDHSGATSVTFGSSARAAPPKLFRPGVLPAAWHYVPDAAGKQTLCFLTQGQFMVQENPRKGGLATWVKNFAKFLPAAVGLYIVLSFEIGSRTWEFGVCMALGANRVKVVAQVIRESLVLTVPGLLAGFAAALVAFRFFSGMLVNVSPNRSPDARRVRPVSTGKQVETGSAYAPRPQIKWILASLVTIAPQRSPIARGSSATLL